MVARLSERAQFTKALNERVAQEHPAKRGRPTWLYNKLRDFCRKHNRKDELLSKATYAYWLAGTKIPKQKNTTLLCDALGISRGELFGESQDPRLSEIIKHWQKLPENMKNGMYSMVRPESDEDAAA